MIIVLTDPVSNTRRKISPLGDGLNWIIQKSTDGSSRSGKEVKSEWGHVEAYAATLDWAIRIAMKKFMLEPDGCTKDVVISYDTAGIIAKAVEERVSQITAEVLHEQDAQDQG